MTAGKRFPSSHHTLWLGCRRSSRCCSSGSSEIPTTCCPIPRSSRSGRSGTTATAEWKCITGEACENAVKGDRKLPHTDTSRRIRKRLRRATVQGKADWEKHSKWRMRRAENPSSEGKKDG